MMVVVFVVSIGLVGALSFFNINISSQAEVKNELVAANLAQEGVELVRNLAEYKRMNPNPGDTWDTIADWFKNNCARIDYTSLASSPRACQSGDYVCFSGGRYQQCAIDPGSGIKRILTINHVNDINGDRLVIRVDVTWNGRTTTANDLIYGNNY